jgi:UDP-N-acetylmuramyl pentapeptide phosphotransferase/UDP-N-acetylglucosamine-1-phosphate transferase
MINLYNFMDGIDGLAGAETVAICSGVIFLAALTRHVDSDMHLATVLLGASVGFLLLNWHPARIFMGDSGSIPIGFLVGWLMLTLVRQGQWAAALILPLYFIVDATWTLLARSLRGETPWQAHRSHAYQRAVLSGLAPDVVVQRITLANVLLIALAIASLTRPISALVLAACTVIALQFNLGRSRSVARDANSQTADDTRFEQPASHDVP